MFNLVKYIGKAIIIPIPSRMVSKMTFMPPQRNKYYSLVNYETRKSYKDAKKAYKDSNIDTIYDIESSYFKFKPPPWGKKSLPVYEVCFRHFLIIAILDKSLEVKKRLQYSDPGFLKQDSIHGSPIREDNSTIST